MKRIILTTALVLTSALSHSQTRKDIRIIKGASRLYSKKEYLGSKEQIRSVICDSCLKNYYLFLYQMVKAGSLIKSELSENSTDSTFNRSQSDVSNLYKTYNELTTRERNKLNRRFKFTQSKIDDLDSTLEAIYYQKNKLDSALYSINSEQAKQEGKIIGEIMFQKYDSLKKNNASFPNQLLIKLKRNGRNLLAQLELNVDTVSNERYSFNVGEYSKNKRVENAIEIFLTSIFQFIDLNQEKKEAITLSTQVTGEADDFDIPKDGIKYDGSFGLIEEPDVYDVMENKYRTMKIKHGASINNSQLALLRACSVKKPFLNEYNSLNRSVQYKTTHSIKTRIIDWQKDKAEQKGFDYRKVTIEIMVINFFRRYKSEVFGLKEPIDIFYLNKRDSIEVYDYFDSGNK